MLSKRIRSYSLESVVNAFDNFTIKIRHQSKKRFKVLSQSQFVVLPDGKTLVGADGLDSKKLVMDDITKGNPSKIGTHKGGIITLLFDSMTETLFVGDISGHVKQYKRSQKSNFFGLLKDSDSFILLKDYGYVGVGRVLSSAQVSRLAIFGGNKNSLAAIDISKQQLCTGVIKSPFMSTNSLEVCRGADSNVYLSIGGSDPNYFSNVSDYLDVTQVYNGSEKKPRQVPEEINQLQKILDLKDESIKSLKIKIKKLEADLKKQKKQNQGTTNEKSLKRKLAHFSRRISHLNRKTSNSQIIGPKSKVTSRKRIYCYSNSSGRTDTSKTTKSVTLRLINLRSLFVSVAKT